jgi:hypothetical protein
VRASVTDTTCQRGGYDAKTQRYKLPSRTANSSIGQRTVRDDDQCPDCRTPPGHAHNPECECARSANTMPLSEFASRIGIDMSSKPTTQKSCPCGEDIWPLERASSRLADKLDHGESQVKVTPVNIPLSAQIDLFEARRWQSLQQMRQDLDDPEFVARLMQLARVRLIDGEAEFGSTMYGWEFDERERNKTEEAADWLVYGTSEDSF